MPQDEEDNLRAFITERITVINLTNAVKSETINFRRATKQKLPDCIIAATAISIGAVLLSDDKRLLNVSFPGLQMQNISI